MWLTGIGLGIACRSGGGKYWGDKDAVFTIWSNKQVESVGTVGQGYVGGLLRVGGEPERCFVSKSVGERLCVKGDMGVGS